MPERKDLTETQQLFLDYHHLIKWADVHISAFDDMDVDLKLKCYGLVMQVEFGDVKGKQPPIYRVEDRLKWNAWRDQTARGFNKVQCMW